MNAYVEIDGKVHHIAVVRNLMDDDICEQIHDTVDTDQEFVDTYIIAHAEKFAGEKFTVN